MGNYYLYRIVHKDSGKDYVGITADVKRRWRHHKNQACSKRNRTSSPYFHAALNKYGIEAFDWNVISICNTWEGVQRLEKLALQLGLGRYNLTLGGEGCLGRKASTRLREVLIARNKSKVWTPEEREKAASALRGSTLPEAVKTKISQSLRGCVRSLETRAKMSAARMGNTAGKTRWQRHRLKQAILQWEMTHD